MPFVPSVLIRLQRPLLRPFGTLIAVGCLPEQVRGRLGIEWSDAEQRRFERLTAVIRTLSPLIPHRLNRWSLLTTMRLIGIKTRKERYRPAPHS